MSHYFIRSLMIVVIALVGFSAIRDVEARQTAIASPGVAVEEVRIDLVKFCAALVCLIGLAAMLARDRMAIEKRLDAHENALREMSRESVRRDEAIEALARTVNRKFNEQP